MNNTDASLQERVFFQLHDCMKLIHRKHMRAHMHGCTHGHGDGRGRCERREAGPAEQRRPHGIHRGQGRILGLLKERGPIGQRDLAELLRVQPPSLSELLSKLEAHGLVERKPNPDDKRAVDIAITEQGRARATEVEAERAAMATSLLGALNQEELVALSDLLGKVIASLEAARGGEGDEERPDDRFRDRFGGPDCERGHHHRHHRHPDRDAE